MSMLQTPPQDPQATPEGPRPTTSSVFITAELDARTPGVSDYRREKQAIQDLAARMLDDPEGILPRFVDLAMEIAGGVSAGLSLYEPDPSPGVFRWRYLRGVLAPFDGATTPRNFSPCGVTLDQNRPVLARHPERVYDWISDAEIIVPEVLLAPLYLGGSTPLGTLWIVSEREGHFHRGHARAMTELAAFVGIALKMVGAERELKVALEQQSLLTREMSHRVKNLFAVADGMVRMSARAAASKEELAEGLSGRLHALASAHSLVSKDLREVGQAPRTPDLASLIQAIVSPHEHAGDARRFRVEGPKVACGDRATNGLALIVHELATNASKYGALAADAGRIDIRWRRDEEDLVLDWVEHGGPAVAGVPKADGFGSALVRRTVAGFGGALAHEWAEEGLTLSLRLPMAAVRG